MEQRIHVIGDSHSGEFQNIENSVIHCIGPRTMYRIGRDGLAILDFRTIGIHENDIVVLTFGEIDVRCHIGKQRDMQKRILNEILDTLLKNYFNTIMLNKSFYKNVTVVLYTVTPPTNNAFNFEFPFYGSIADRVNISRKLNEKLVKMASENGLEVINVYNDFADAAGKLIPALSDMSVHIKMECNQPIRDQMDKILCRCLFSRDSTEMDG